MSEWEYCELLTREPELGIRVLEYNPEKDMYRERVLDERDGLDDVVGTVYES